jgi:hypothetical protein
MTERRASRTAVTVCQARAVAHGRTAPGRFADPTAMPLLRASRLIVNYQLPTLIGDAVRKVIGLLAGRQNPWATEPWRSAWSVRAMAGLLARHGFAVRSDRDLLEIADGLGVRLGQRNSMRNSRVAVAER